MSGANPQDESGQDNGETLKRFDMYRFFSRKDLILAIALVVAFLIFSLAVRFVSQPI